MNAYRLTNSKRSGDQLGPCEVCKRPVDGNHWRLVKLHRYPRPDGTEGLSYDWCAFGHRACLAAKTEPQGRHE